MRFKTIFHITLSVFLFAGIMLGAYLAPTVHAQENEQNNEVNQEEEMEEREVMGEIVMISDRELTLRVNGQQEFFMIAEDAEITRDDEDIERGDLRVGDRVEIMVEDENTVTALTVLESAPEQPPVDEPVIIDEEADETVIWIIVAVVAGLLVGWGLVAWRKRN